MSVRAARLALLIPLFLASSVLGAGEPEPIWRKGPLNAELGEAAGLEVPAGFLFVERKDMNRFLEMTGNLPSDEAVGALLPDSEDAHWVIYFEFEEVGYVKDDEKDKLDGDKLLQTLREGNERANEVRREKGWSTLSIVGWDQPPFYDPETHNLTWAVRGRSGTHDVVNYNSRILGRKGIMSANLVTDPDKLAATVPTYKQLLRRFAYKAGDAYGEFRKGDKVAAYGLAALVAGGGAVAAAKLGLFAKLGKFIGKFAKLILLGAVALFAAIGRFVRRFFGREKPSRS